MGDEEAHDDTRAGTQAAPRPSVVAAIAAGGVLGVLARYGITRAIHVAPATFPWATFWINVTGSFVLGVVVVLIVERYPTSTYLRPFVAVGFLGAYTTFSTFAVETVLLVRDGSASIAAAYVVAGCAVGLGAAFAGITLGLRVGRRPESPPC